MNQERAEAAVKELLLALDQDITKEDFLDTPGRVARMLIEQCSPEPNGLDRCFSEEKYDELVLVRDIPWVGCCPHHMVFFYGVAHIGYLPGEKILGLSKLARLIKSCSKGFITQEIITRNVADTLSKEVKPRGCIVVMEATHGCMTCRGVRAIGSSTITSAIRGIFRDVPAIRSEFFSLINRRAS